MLTYTIRRVLQMILVLLLVTVMVFLTVRLLPGDPILMYLTAKETKNLTQERVDIIKHEVGLDRPLVVQYFDWLGRAVRGDLGQSIITRRSVADDIKHKLPITLQLGITAFILSIIIGIPLGIISAMRRSTWLDTLLTTIGNLGVCIPIFWLGIILIYLFSLKLDWLPTYGYISPFKDFGLNIKYLILPVFCEAIPGIASAVRLTRSSMLEVMRQDYIRTAWAKGLKERTVILGHALKNGLIPVVTLKGMTFASIIAGSVLIETVFSIPGMGRMDVQGLLSHDYTVVQDCMLVFGVVILACNLLVDLSYGWLDPRVRYE